MVENEIMATLGMNDPSAMIANTGHGILVTFMVILWIAIIGGVVWFAIWFNSFKIHVIIREVTNKRRFITSDRAKVVVVDGVEYYKLRKRKVLLNIPPPEALEITAKGRYFCECYHDGRAGKKTGYQWIKDETEDIKDLLKTVDVFRPLPTMRQAQLVNRLRKAEARKGQSLLDKILPVAAITLSAMIVAIPFIFYGELTKANTDAMELTKQITNLQGQTTAELTKAIELLTGRIEEGEFKLTEGSLEEQLTGQPPDATEVGS